MAKAKRTNSAHLDRTMLNVKSAYIKDLGIECLARFKLHDPELIVKVASLLKRFETTHIDKQNYESIKQGLKSKIVETLGFHPWIDLIMNFDESYLLDNLGVQYSKSDLTAACILYKITKLKEAENNNDIKHMENASLDIAKFELAYRLFTRMDAGELKKTDAIFKVFSMYDQKRLAAAKAARHHKTDEAIRDACIEFRRIYSDPVNANYTEAATNIFWDYFKEDKRISFRAYSVRKQKYLSDMKLASVDKSVLRNYIDKTSISVFSPCKTLATHFSKCLSRGINVCLLGERH